MKSWTPRLLGNVSDNALLIKLGPSSESRVRACPGLFAPIGSVGFRQVPSGSGLLINRRPTFRFAHSHSPKVSEYMQSPDFDLDGSHINSSRLIRGRNVPYQ